MTEINCNIYCPAIIKIINSCPTKDIFSYSTLVELNPNEAIFEFFAVGLSALPYLLSFVILLSTIFYKTTRSTAIFIMMFGQNFLLETIKNTLRDPRPNFKCNNQFGNPSNHASFFTSLSFWLLLEILFLEAKYRYQNTWLKLAVFLITPIVMYVRIYLKYHNVEQIFNGMFLGGAIAAFWFIFVVFYQLKDSNSVFSKVMMKYKFVNNLGSKIFYDAEEEIKNSKMYKQYMDLTNRQKDLSKMNQSMDDIQKTIQKMGFSQVNDQKFSAMNATQFRKNKIEEEPEQDVEEDEENYEDEEGEFAGEDFEGDGEEDGDIDPNEFSKEEIQEALKELKRMKKEANSKKNEKPSNVPKNKEKYQ